MSKYSEKVQNEDVKTKVLGKKRNLNKILAV
jgi:hypothetical protein